ncbi:type II toxin-antitoxin system RelE/ParE family toxin [Candidatus Synechococcus spongiarum]|uniref:type II toxin-antitoxin system RelE/ParE family toxin n=1 Tax=Candidatus Synechococcus spongiarum TaxID=431041 RepID=UPI0011782D57|nr:type II toxin-antitoxin system RelE/ParE family toxin [Candidatus Synechococcus spongiarum]
MIERRREHSSEFERHLQSLLKKDRDLRQKVEKELELRRKQGPGKDPLLKGVNCRPVFKMRVQAQGCGKRGGARVIYYCDHERLLALLIFLKSKKANMSSEDLKQIQAALQDAGLWPK